MKKRSAFPLDVHKTYEGPEKEYESLARGRIDVKRLVNKMLQYLRPTFEEVDINVPHWCNREVLNIDDRFMSLIRQKELKLTEDAVNQFLPVPVQHLTNSQIGIGWALDSENPGLIVKGADRAFSFGFPSYGTFEDQLEEAVEIDYLNENLE